MPIRPRSQQLIDEGEARAERTRQIAYRQAGLSFTEWDFRRLRCEAMIRKAKAPYAMPSGELTLPKQFDLDLWRAVRKVKV